MPRNIATPAQAPARSANALRLLRFAAACAAMAACSDGSNNFSIDVPPAPSLIPIERPAISDPPPGTGELFLPAQAFDLAEVGYEQQEYFLEGSASSFINTGELLADGAWEAEPTGGSPYKTRIVVQRPLNPDDFRNTVVVEWMNVTAGFDNPVCWSNGHVELYRSGHIWVGVTAQEVAIEGSEAALLPLNLKSVNPERYASLSHPGDSFSYDIFTQVVAALRYPVGVDPLAGTRPVLIVACGQSQAANWLVTYTNAVLPLYAEGYDGVLITSRTRDAAPLSRSPQADIPTPEAPRIRPDTSEPVLVLQAENDLTTLGFSAARQEDNDLFRLWEVAGSSHSDYYSTESGRNDATGEPEFAAVLEADTIAGVLQCDAPVNSGPFHYVFNAALRALPWTVGSNEPPRAPRLNLDDQGKLVRDSNGNATGGIRMPQLEAPTAVLSGEGNEGSQFCSLFGTTALFSADRMASLYIDEAGYVEAVRNATAAAEAAGFLSAEDASAIRNWAPSQWQSQQDN